MADNNNARRLFCTLEILKKYSDDGHKLSQQDIIKLLWDLYEIKADRKTVKNNILNLIDMGYEINYDTKIRNQGKPGENEIWYNYYMDNEFNDSELRLLIDSVLFSPNISPCQSKELIKKLQDQSNVYFKDHTKHITSMPSRKSDNQQLFLTIEIIDEAITKKKKISFKHMIYGTNLESHIARGSLGSEIKWRVSPYQMAMSEGKYYLICAHVNDKIVHIPLSEMVDVKILDEKAQPFTELIGSNGQPLNIKEYMKEHIYMCSGEPIRARLRILNELVFHVVTDTFGKDVKVINPDSKGRIDIEVKAPESAIFQFATKYLGCVLVIEPDEIANRMMEVLARTYKRYQIVQNKNEFTGIDGGYNGDK